MKGKNVDRSMSGRGLAIPLAILLVLMATVPGLAQTGPETMNYQGRLLDASGNPRSGETHCLRFRICNDQDCLTQLWPGSGYEHHVVTTESGSYTGGLFTVVLGTSYAISPEMMYDYDALYLETGVADEATCPGTTWATLLPRSRLQTSAYAQRSRRVRTVETDDEYLISVENDGQGGGILGNIESSAMGASAGLFVATSSTGQTYGLQATNLSRSDGAAAGLFHAVGLEGATRGIDVGNFSTTDDATAGYFHAEALSGKTYGIWSKNRSVTGGASAGYFHAQGTSGNTYGLVAQNDSTTDQARAGHFWANGNSGQTYGLVSLNDSLDSDSVAGYFRASGGVGVHARSDSENSIEAYSSATERRFYVSNSGNVWADGAFVAPSADFAEMWPAEEVLEPGDVLVINVDGLLTRSSFAYDTDVVGVYSTQPAFIAGSDEAMANPGKVPLAVVGIVPVRACDNGGPILPGDLLVTSDEVGHVMKAEPNPPTGTVVGKALEPLESGADIIQMLVSLQ